MSRLGSTGGSNTIKGTSLSTTVTAATTYLALFTSDPTTSGASGEASGGSPAYARKSVSWNAASYSGGTETITNSATITFDVPAGTYAYWGLFDASSGGNYLLGGTTTSQTFSAQGQYQIAAGNLSITAS